MSDRRGRHLPIRGRHRAGVDDSHGGRGRHVDESSTGFRAPRPRLVGKPLRTLLVTTVGAMTVMVGGLFAFASDLEIIDLASSSGLTVVDHDAVFQQGGVGAGTGQFDPFTTANPGGSTSPEEAVTVCDDPGCPSPEFHTHTGGGRTHEILLSAIPELIFDGSGPIPAGTYREFTLDANDQGSDDYMSIDEIHILLDEDVDLTGYNPTTRMFTTDPGDPAVLVWDLDVPILMRSQTFTPGSGVSDITVLIPTETFDISGEDCSYGSSECTQWVYFYFEAGAFDESTHVGDPLPSVIQDKDWDVSSGFEEWRTRKLPVVDVEKTADTSYVQDYVWTIEKYVSSDEDGGFPDGSFGETATIDLFTGDNQDAKWKVIVDRELGATSDAMVSGTIEVFNPTGGAGPIEPSINAEINSVEDLVTLGAAPPAGATVTCPETFPFTLGAGETLTCTYEYAAPTTDDGTNEARVNIDNGLGGTQDYSGFADVLWGDAVVTDINDSAVVTDDESPLNESVTDDNMFMYTVNYECDDDEGDTVNTAVVTPDDGGEPDDDDATLTVNCYGLTTTKDAIESLTRTYTWDIEKTVSQDTEGGYPAESFADSQTLDLFNGDSGEVKWMIEVTRNEPTDSEWKVMGTITVSNPAPMDAVDVSVSDMISGFAGSIVIDCGDGAGDTTVTVPAAVDSTPGEATCSYSATLPNGDTRTNTATASLFGEDYDGDATIDFSEATVTEVDATADVEDDSGPLGTGIEGSQTYMYTEEFTCDADEGNHENEATVTPADEGSPESDTADVDVNCYGLTVTKDADTSYSRDYDWDIAKTRFITSSEDDGDGDPMTLTLSEGQTYTASYEVTVTMTGFTDDDHAVEGTITITNPAPLLADDVAVSDVISHATESDITATVDCDAADGIQTTVDIPAAVDGTPGQATCSYSADLPNADDRTNTATATLFGIGYDGTADVTFDLENPDVEIDECVDVVDDAGTVGDPLDDIDLGTVCVDDLDENDQWSDTYTIDIGPFEACGEYEFTNTVYFETTDDANDTDESGSATYTVVIDVPCPEGCSLTQGYWKTHNETFPGGAPPDDTWELIGPLAEGETFFSSGQTYYEVMWTAPKGNAYYQLAGQYIAAVLNGLNGADTTSISTELAAAEALFMTYTPDQIDKKNVDKDLRKDFIELAGTLADYNEGEIGPGHCDEDGTTGFPILPIPAWKRGRHEEEEDLEF